MTKKKYRAGKGDLIDLILHFVVIGFLVSILMPMFSADMVQFIAGIAIIAVALKIAELVLHYFGWI